MPRVVPGLEVERWLAEEPEGPRRAAVERWLLSLAVGPLPVPERASSADPSDILEIPDTDLIAVYIAIPALDAMVIERIISA